MSKPLQLDDNAPWKQRFRGATIAGTQLARANPSRGLVSYIESGQYQLYAWDVDSGELHPLTDRPEGVLFGFISPDGRFIYYMDDNNGDEIGHFVRVPFEGGEPEDISPELPPYCAFGVTGSRAGNMLGTTISNDQGFHTTVWKIGQDGTIGTPKKVYHTRRLMFGPTFSYNGEIGVVGTPENSKFQHNSLLAFDIATRKRIGEIREEGAILTASMFSPVPGDFQLLVMSNRTGYNRPFLWNPVSGKRIELALDELSADISVMDWSSDGKRLLLSNSWLAIQRLYIYELATGELTRLDHPGGFYSMCMFFNSGDEICAGWQDSTHPPQAIALNSRTGRKTRDVLSVGKVPPSKPWKHITFKSTDGETIQGWLGLPDGEGPFPTILHTHGGPETATVEYYIPDSQAWIDHGFAWLAINYRGSTSFGKAFREKIWGDLGHWEIEDMVAARNWLVDSGIADPQKILLTGWSYGGYLTCHGLAKRPDLWAGGMAGMATVDWAMEYEDLSAGMQGYSVSLMGGTPQEKPEQYAKISPMNYIENIKAPLLIIQGRNDTRTPARPVEVFEARMKALGKAIEVYWYDTGHLGSGLERDIYDMELMLKFAYRVLGRPT